MIKFITLIIAVLTIISCSTNPQENIEKHKLLNTLQSVKGKGILFGHQDTYAYGFRWKDKEGYSDVKRVAGDYPAMFGWWWNRNGGNSKSGYNIIQ